MLDHPLYCRVIILSCLLALAGCGAANDPGPPNASAVAKVQGAKEALDPSSTAEDSSNSPTSDGGAQIGQSEPSAKPLVSVPNLGTRSGGVDWPKFLGPTGDSKSSETGILTKWPAAGPRIVWQREIGEGYGIGSVSLGRFLQFDRYGELARLWCLHAETGEELWKFEYPTDYVDLYGYNGGPRATPVIDHDRVYIYGAEGMLHCLNVVDGSLVWKVNTLAEFGVIQNFFGVGSTPVVFGDLLLVMIGGSPDDDKQLPPGQLDRVSSNGSAIVAFDKFTGAVRYKSGNDLASYSSLRLAKIEDRSWCLAFCRGGLLGLDAATGRVMLEFPWRAKTLESVNASTPVVSGNQIFISETYSIGSSLLEISGDKHRVIWQDDDRRREKSFKAHWNTPILVDDYLYGCSGRNPPDAEQRCIEWKTGKVMWSKPTQIRTSLLYVDGHFVCLGEFGVLQLLKVNPRKLDVVAEVKLRNPDAVGPTPPGLEAPGLLRSPCWAAPILSHGLLYVRGDDRLVCLELIPEREQTAPR